MVWEIRQAISKSFDQDPQQAMPGFAVEGTGLDALRNVHAVLVLGEKRKTNFPVGAKISAFIFRRGNPASFQLLKSIAVGVPSNASIGLYSNQESFNGLMSALQSFPYWICRLGKST